MRWVLCAASVGSSVSQPFDGEKCPVEVRRRGRGVHAVGVGAPGAVVALLEQAAAVRADAVPVVEDRCSPDSPIAVMTAMSCASSRDVKGTSGGDDRGGVGELFGAVPGDRLQREAATVQDERGAA